VCDGLCKAGTRLVRIRRLAHYLLKDRLARDATGDLCRAWDAANGQWVFLKALPPALLAWPELRERFFREVGILCELEHPNLLRVLDGGVVGGRPFVVIEWVRGYPLPEFLDSVVTGVRPLRRAMVSSIADQIAGALHFLHSHGVSHGALAPSSVILCPDGTVRLTGLGGAFIVGETDPGRAVDERVDIRAFVEICCHMLAAGRARVLDRSQSEPDLFGWLWEDSLRLFDRDAERRLWSFDTVLMDLDRLMRGSEW